MKTRNVEIDGIKYVPETKVKPKEEPKPKTAGEKWAKRNPGTCPFLVEGPRGYDGRYICSLIKGGCDKCHEVIVPAYNAALDNLPTAEEYIKWAKVVSLNSPYGPIAHKAARGYIDMIQKQQEGE